MSEALQEVKKCQDNVAHVRARLRGWEEVMEVPGWRNATSDGTLIRVSREEAHRLLGYWKYRTGLALSRAGLGRKDEHPG